MTSRVLVVEDDPRLSKSLQSWLKVNGYDPVGAESLRGAVAAVQFEHFDVAIVDFHLPDGTGADLLAFLAEHDPRLVCLILTGNPTVDNAVTTLRHWQAFDFLTKPLHDMAKLQQALEAALSHRRTLGADPGKAKALPPDLSAREGEILTHLADGLTNKDIAQRAAISEKTVSNHLTTIYQKLGVDSRAQAIVLYQRWRMTSP